MNGSLDFITTYQKILLLIFGYFPSFSSSNLSELMEKTILYQIL